MLSKRKISREVIRKQEMVEGPTNNLQATEVLALVVVEVDITSEIVPALKSIL